LTDNGYDVRYPSNTPPVSRFIMPPPYGHFGIARSVLRLSVSWRSCLGYRHTGCLRLSHRRPPEMCGLRTRPRTDVDPPRSLFPSVAPPGFCNRGEVRYGSVGGLEYEVPQKLTHLLQCTHILHNFWTSTHRGEASPNFPWRRHSLSSRQLSS